jgi:hypothetical protein
MTATLWRTGAFGALLLVGVADAASAQENLLGAPDLPYFVTYNDHMEKRGELEVEVLSTLGDPKDGAARYFAPWIELEYGVMRKWTAELYLEGASITHNDSAFTGWRIENRFRPFEGNHFVNPVLYIEYESISEASRIQKEIVGEGAVSPETIRALDEEHAHELEGRLILSTDLAKWNISENLILEKNLSEDEGVEFGYAFAVSRRLGKFYGGVEVYGGLGVTQPEPAETRHFVAPVVTWRPTPRSLFKVSVGFGVTEASERYLLRVGYSMELW